MPLQSPSALNVFGASQSTALRAYSCQAMHTPADTWHHRQAENHFHANVDGNAEDRKPALRLDDKARQKCNMGRVEGFRLLCETTCGGFSP